MNTATLPQTDLIKRLQGERVLTEAALNCLLRGPVTPNGVAGPPRMLRPIRTDQEGNTMRITIDLDTEREPLSESDRAILRAIASDGAVPTGVIVHAALPEPTPEPVKAPAKAPAPKAAPKKAAPEPEVAPSATETTEAEPEATPEPEPTPEPTPEPAKATSTDLPVMELLVKQAAELISSGERARVKVALDAVGAARVSEVTPEQADAFMKALG